MVEAFHSNDMHRGVGMPVQTLNPAGLPDVGIYQQVAVASGTRSIYLAGQVARTADGTPVGPGDLAAQTEQALRNVHTGLAAAGASFADLARLTFYVVDWKPDQMDQLLEGLARVTGRVGEQLRPPMTLIGVAALAEPDIMIEIEAVAVLP
jgi:enamine deaminase RidA (YjgF/YER057c/UK114 family)